MLKRSRNISDASARWLKISLLIFFSSTVVFLFWVLGSSQASASQDAFPWQAKIGEGVYESLLAEGSARVVVALIDSPSQESLRRDLDSLKQDVASQQETVLSQLDPTDFDVKIQYQAVPALAGTLLTEGGLETLAKDPNVAKIDLDVSGRGSLANSVPHIGADSWHTAGFTGNGVVVAVLDSGLDTDHDDLATALIHQECFLDNDGAINGSGLCPNGSDRQSGSGAAEDDAGHGTHVTGIVASRGNQSSVGVAPGTQIVSIKVTAGPSFAGVFYYFSEVVAALDYIINNRPDVQIINMSLGTNATFAGDCDSATSWTIAGANAINTLRTNGVISFASSGNTGSGTNMTAPACLSNVISVGATDLSDNVASFTSSNASTDIMAPGVSILSSNLSNGTFTASGTSMASPHAAGCAALLIQAREAITPDQIETRLENSPIQVTDATNGRSFPRIECSLKPMSGVSLDGPTFGIVGTDNSFTATVNPITATQPMTYVWQSTGQPTIINTGGLSNTISLNWNLGGVKEVTVTVQNAAGSVSDKISINIVDEEIENLLASNDSPTSLGNSTQFTATISKGTDVNYLWVFGDGETASIKNPTHIYTETGIYTATVTATNGVSFATATTMVTINPLEIYLPVVLKPQ